MDSVKAFSSAITSPLFFDGRNSKLLATRTVDVRSAPSRSTHFSLCSRPLKTSALPFFANWAIISASRPKTVTLNQSATDSRLSPIFTERLLATERLTTGVPPFVRRSSGSNPKRPDSWQNALIRLNAPFVSVFLRLFANAFIARKRDLQTAITFLDQAPTARAEPQRDLRARQIFALSCEDNLCTGCSG